MVKKICQGNKDYKIASKFYGFFLAPKTKHCLDNNEFGIIEEHKNF